MLNEHFLRLDRSPSTVMDSFPVLEFHLLPISKPIIPIWNPCNYMAQIRSEIKSSLIYSVLDDFQFQLFDHFPQIRIFTFLTLDLLQKSGKVSISASVAMFSSSEWPDQRVKTESNSPSHSHYSFPQSNPSVPHDFWKVIQKAVDSLWAFSDLFLQHPSIIELFGSLFEQSWGHVRMMYQWDMYIFWPGSEAVGIMANLF